MRILFPLLLLYPSSNPSSSEEIAKVLSAARDKAELPGMVAGIVRGGRLTGVAAVGVRKAGVETPMEADDLVHLGSNTKSMTATVVAKLIEEGKLDWDTPLSKVFPEESKEWHPDWRGVTVHQLLTHTAGLPADVEYDHLKGKTNTDKRRAILAQDWLKEAADPKPGSRFRYSNVGYILAGLVAETVTGKSWEDLMRQLLFEPLGMTRAGFGPPGTPGEVDQPWGHSIEKGKRSPSRLDNPPCLGPAGRVHAPLADWAKFAILHLQGERPGGEAKQLLKPETFRKLHTPVKNNYACGWVRLPTPEKGEPYLFHNGSNTMWYAEMWLDPAKQVAVLVATNEGGFKAEQAVRSAALELLKLAKKGDEHP